MSEAFSVIMIIGALVLPHHPWHDGGIDYAQARQAVDAQSRVDDGH